MGLREAPHVELRYDETVREVPSEQKNSDPYQEEVLDPCCESYAQSSAWLSVTDSK